VEKIFGMKASILIRNEHLVKLGVDNETIIDIALNNTEKNGFELLSMNSIVEDLYTEEDKVIISDDYDLKVYTNHERTFGAISIMYIDNLQDKMNDELEQGIYIIPSSIHEIIIVPKKLCNSEYSINNMITEVNLNEVDTEEVLSGHAYYYSNTEGFRIV